ncbi:MAG TPA: hypothetical protein VGN01_04505, partial [Acidobacteriaceae bacterium]
MAIVFALRGQLADLRKAKDEAQGRESNANAKAATSAAEATAALVGKAAALKEVEAANRRADDMVGKEQEKLQAIVRAKDDQIEKLNEFIAGAKEAMTKEFQAVSGGVLKDAREQLAKRAEEIINQHGEKTSGDVALHKEQIAKMLGPVEESMKRLDKHVEESNVARSNAETLLDEQI